VQRRHKVKNRIVEDYVELCQEGIEQVQGVHKVNFFSSLERREVSRRRHLQSYWTLCKIIKECLSRSFQEGTYIPSRRKRDRDLQGLNS
jgi:hypothetical protein